MSRSDCRPWDYEYKTCPTCGTHALLMKKSTYCSAGCSKKGKPRPDMWGNTFNWRGDDAGLSAMHVRVYKALGRAKDHVCIGCGHPARDWANLTGHYEDIDDYQALCRSCHNTYDKRRQCASS